PIRPNSTRSSGYGCISETIASRTAFFSPLTRSSAPVVRPGIGCSTKLDASDHCVPIPGSNGSAINQVGIRGLGAEFARCCRCLCAACLHGVGVGSLRCGSEWPARQALKGPQPPYEELSRSGSQIGFVSQKTVFCRAQSSEQISISCYSVSTV